jgi:hypothetical protein
MDRQNPPGRTHSRGEAPNDRYELERFRLDIDLVAFAASKGYAIDQRESSRSCCMMRHSGGDKIAVGRAKDGHWQFYSFRDERDNGDIIQFVQNRSGGRTACSLGMVRKELRAWTHTEREPSEVPRRRVDPVVADRASVASEVARAKVVERHPYLESRGLAPATLACRRFQGTWLRDDSSHGNVIFPHYDEQGLSGFEVKNHGFTGFAKGGSKGIWSSKVAASDERLVIAESAIDALSYHQVNPHPKARYVSVGGAQNGKQPALLESAISWMRAGSVVVAATDKDKAGDAYAERIAELCGKHPHVKYERHAPALGKDWNDQLRTLRDRELPQATNRLAGSTSRYERDSGIPAETMEFFKRSNATFERAFGTTREGIQSEIRAHLARDGFTPDRSGRGGLER